MPLQDGSEGILKKWQTSLHQRDIDVVIGSHGDEQPRGGNLIIDLFESLRTGQSKLEWYMARREAEGHIPF